MKKRCLFPITMLLSPVLGGSATTARRAAFIPNPAFIPNLAKPRQPITHMGGALVSTEPSVDLKVPSTSLSPLVDIPMQRLKLPRFAVGREYVVVPLKIHGEGPFEFVLDTGLTIELITPHLVHTLKHASDGGIIDTREPAVVEGLAAGGTTAKEKLVELSGASVFDGERELQLPTLQAAITDFAQENMDPRHPVEGMLGMVRETCLCVCVRACLLPNSHLSPFTHNTFHLPNCRRCSSCSTSTWTFQQVVYGSGLLELLRKKQNVQVLSKSLPPSSMKAYSSELASRGSHLLKVPGYQSLHLVNPS